MYADWRSRWPELRDCLRSKQRGSLSCKVRTLPSRSSRLRDGFLKKQRVFTRGPPGNALMLGLSGQGCQEKLKLRPAAVRGRPGLRVIKGSSRLAALIVQCPAVVALPVAVGARTALIGGDISARRTGAVVMVDAAGRRFFLLVDGVER